MHAAMRDASGVGLAGAAILSMVLAVLLSPVLLLVGLFLLREKDPLTAA